MLANMPYNAFKMHCLSNFM